MAAGILPRVEGKEGEGSEMKDEGRGPLKRM